MVSIEIIGQTLDRMIRLGFDMRVLISTSFPPMFILE